MRLTEREFRGVVRRILVESSGAKGPTDLAALGGSYIIISPNPEAQGGIEVYYSDEREDPPADAPQGRVATEPISQHQHYGPQGHAGGAHQVSSSDATQGWGPMLYDVAMEVTTLLGAALTPDRGTVSQSAKRVWDYYYTRRASPESNRPVASEQLDDENNTLTLDPEDNAWQGAAKSWGGDKWHQSSLSRSYKSSGAATLQELSRLGLVEFVGMEPLV